MMWKWEESVSLLHVLTFSSRNKMQFCNGYTALERRPCDQGELRLNKRYKNNIVKPELAAVTTTWGGMGNPLALGEYCVGAPYANEVVGAE